MIRIVLFLIHRFAVATVLQGQNQARYVAVIGVTLARGPGTHAVRRKPPVQLDEYLVGNLMTTFEWTEFDVFESVRVHSSSQKTSQSVWNDNVSVSVGHEQRYGHIIGVVWIRQKTRDRVTGTETRFRRACVVLKMYVFGPIRDRRVVVVFRWVSVKGGVMWGNPARVRMCKLAVGLNRAAWTSRQENSSS